ncbi:MAG: PQQ-binding-like beta-propeller repeat protein [Paracoccaceae bacterium]
MKISRGVFILAALAALAGCSKGELVLEGDRQDLRSAVIGAGGEAEPGASLAPKPGEAKPISLPAAQSNADWTHRGGSPAHAIGNVALAAPLTQIWAAPIGRGDDRKHRITADPVVAGARIFTLDSRATVTATGADGATLWQTDLTPAADRDDDASGGGLAFGAGLVFATTGFGELVALDPASGTVAWRQKFDAPVGGAPTVADGRVYVVARDASAWAVTARNGKVEWQLPGTPSVSGVIGVSSPAVDSRQVVFPFASGQLVAVAKDSGVGLWQAYVAGKRLGRAYATISDLTGDPVISGGVVYAGTSAGRLAAVDADTGQALWSAPEGAASPVVVAGGAVFLVNDEDQILRLDADTGAEVWRVDLPYFTRGKDKRRRNIFAHYGPVLAGGRLVVASSDGLIRSIDPVSGAVLATVELPAGAASAPVVAGRTLYVVTQNGQLHAFR